MLGLLPAEGLLALTEEFFAFLELFFGVPTATFSAELSSLGAVGADSGGTAGAATGLGTGTAAGTWEPGGSKAGGGVG